MELGRRWVNGGAKERTGMRGVPSDQRPDPSPPRRRGVPCEDRTDRPGDENPGWEPKPSAAPGVAATLRRSSSDIASVYGERPASEEA
jgi:hypothetical protein